MVSDLLVRAAAAGLVLVTSGWWPVVAVYAPRCCDTEGNTFSQGSLFYHDPQRQCVVLLCIDGVAVWYKDFCSTSNSCLTSNGALLPVGESYWQPLAASRSCQLLTCSEEGNVVQRKRVVCYDQLALVCIGNDPDKNIDDSTSGTVQVSSEVLDSACCSVLESCNEICRPFLHCPEVFQAVTETGELSEPDIPQVSTCVLPVDRNNLNNHISDSISESSMSQLGVICPKHDFPADEDKSTLHTYAPKISTQQLSSYPTQRHPESDPGFVSTLSNITTAGRRILLSAPTTTVAQNAEIKSLLRQASSIDGGRKLKKAQREAQCRRDELVNIDASLKKSGKVAQPQGSTVGNSFNSRGSVESVQQGMESLRLVLTSQLLIKIANDSSRSHASDLFDCLDVNNKDVYESKSSDNGVYSSKRFKREHKSETCSSGGDNGPVANLPICSVQPPISCDCFAKYRTADGTCNNLNHPLYGSANTQLRRIFGDTYSDGIHQPTDSEYLPSARQVSEKVMDFSDEQSNYYTIALTFWGQFTDHDLSHTPIHHFDDGTPIECCSPETEPPPTPPIHPFCWPIEVASDDTFYSVYQKRCMNFVRSVTALPETCQPGPGEQMNELTHWLDGSQIYGSSLQQQISLRKLTGGKMRTSAGNLLPLEEPHNLTATGFATSCRGCICFVAGDSRVNEIPLLTLLHTIWLREHNRIANAIQSIRPSFSDEVVFQETRRIIVAMLQHITMYEWLPALLGYNYCEAVGLTLPSGSTFSNAYFNSLFANIANEFSTAAFRLHSLIQNVVVYAANKSKSDNGTTSTDPHQPLSSLFFTPDVITYRFASMARGMLSEKPQQMDRGFVRSVRGLLFFSGTCGLDLVALNIQRGRDHGLVKYVDVLRWCTGISVQSWEHLYAVMSVETVQRLFSVYHHWTDIDLYAGLNSEKLAPGALVGPTTRCLIAEQFLRLRYGDRFFYELSGQSGSFNTEQLLQIKTTTSLAAVLCRNVGDDFTHVQRHVFFQHLSFFNPKVNCSVFPDIDISVFV